MNAALIVQEVEGLQEEFFRVSKESSASLCWTPATTTTQVSSQFLSGSSLSEGSPVLQALLQTTELLLPQLDLVLQLALLDEER